jgi:hypothetical protein
MFVDFWATLSHEFVFVLGFFPLVLVWFFALFSRITNLSTTPQNTDVYFYLRSPLLAIPHVKFQ